MSETQSATGWLSGEQLEQARDRLPIVYVDAVPVRCDERGQVTRLGLLLRMRDDGSISRSLVSGRVQYGELIRDALVRHIEKDLGPLALPRIPSSPQPFTVAEYFPDPTVTGYHDPRQHAVSLAYIVTVDGECQPSAGVLDLVWATPAEAAGVVLGAEMSGGQDRLLRAALAHLGLLP